MPEMHLTSGTMSFSTLEPILLGRTIF